MERLTKKEEEIMQILWEIEKGFVKDVIEKLNDQKAPYTTVSSIIRILEGKGFVGHKAYGNTYEYYPLITKTDYTKNILPDFVKKYFDNSIKDVVSFLVQDKNLSAEEVQEIISIINRLPK